MAEENKSESKLRFQEIEARRKERIAEITGQIEDGCRGILNSDSFRTYMQTMAKFHRYSYRNSLLIFLQKPDSTMIASYTDWQKKFGRHVNKGEKGIQIIAPAPYKTTREVDRKDPVTGQVMLDSDGNPIKESKEITIPRFKAVSVFDYSQTSGRPLPTLGIKELQASVENYDVFLSAIRNISPVPVRFTDIEGGAKGYYDRANKEIVIQGGMPELQTLKTAIHEVVHSYLHDDRSKMLTPDGQPKDKGIIETEAEGCALVCLTHFGFEDVGDYSFPYLVSYASSPDLKELHASLATIQETSSMVINSLETEMLQLTLERDPDRYEIYQIPIGSPVRDIKFMPMEEMRRNWNEINKANYSMVYSASLGVNDTLDGLYEKFNIDQPAGYSGHSLSISDVVVLHRNGEDKAFYVDSYGFEEVPGFMQGESYVPAEHKQHYSEISGEDQAVVAEKPLITNKTGSLLQGLKEKQSLIGKDRNTANDSRLHASGREEQVI